MVEACGASGLTSTEILTLVGSVITASSRDMSVSLSASDRSNVELLIVAERLKTESANGDHCFILVVLHVCVCKSVQSFDRSFYNCY